ncbi:hypothetical protein Tco_1480474, partial [Tanacetum coccineum]
LLSPPPATVEPSATPLHPKSYMNIMSMIQRGKRPPNILSTHFFPFLSLGILRIYAHLSQEINDLPPNLDIMVPGPLLFISQMAKGIQYLGDIIVSPLQVVYKRLDTLDTIFQSNTNWTWVVDSCQGWSSSLFCLAEV